MEQAVETCISPLDRGPMSCVTGSIESGFDPINLRLNKELINKTRQRVLSALPLHTGIQ